MGYTILLAKSVHRLTQPNTFTVGVIAVEFVAERADKGNGERFG
ncbi:MAG: hypothetical protein AAGM27_06405 [Cyanobacteria bacterium J06554_3]